MAVLGAAILVSCRSEPEPESPPAVEVELVATAVPGDTWTIAEVTTLERTIARDGIEVLEDTEIGREILVDVTQVAPDGQPMRYRKTYNKYRQETQTRLAGVPGEPVAPSPDGENLIDSSAEVHALEGQTLEFAWRDARWHVTGASGVEGRSTRGHPWLPDGPVAVGARWQTDLLPFALPGVEDGDGVVSLEFVSIESSEAGRRVARVNVVVTFDEKPSVDGALEGFYEFVVADERGSGRLRRLQMAGELTVRHADGATETMGIVTFRGTE